MSVFMPPKGESAARTERDSLASRLMHDTYAIRALVPASPWMSNGAAAPAAPLVREEPDGRTGATFLIATLPPTQVARTWVIWRWDGRQWISELRPADGPTLTLAVASTAGEGVGYWISWIDRIGTESPRTGWLRTSDNVARLVTP